MEGTKARGTVIIPTFGEARFAEWAIRSVQDQTVRDLEICVVCDGSAHHMVEFLRELAIHDHRIRIFTYPKSPRTGEPYRDEVIRQTSGTIICYCGHDDLWLPDHVESVERTLSSNHFTNSIHASVNTPEEIHRTGNLFSMIHTGDLQDPASLAQLRNNENFFGLTCGAHTRAAYFQLPEGWVTTPVRELPTDLHMWKKFTEAFPEGIATTHRITALNFPFVPRQSWPESQRSQELETYYDKIRATDSLNRIQDAAAAQQCRQLRDVSRQLGDVSLQLGDVSLQLGDVSRQLGDVTDKYSSLSREQSSLRYLVDRLKGEVSRRLRSQFGRRPANGR